MDPESFEKWKQDYQNERREHFNRVKELQKETLNRRRFDFKYYTNLKKYFIICCCFLLNFILLSIFIVRIMRITGFKLKPSPIRLRSLTNLIKLTHCRDKGKTKTNRKNRK